MKQIVYISVIVLAVLAYGVLKQGWLSSPNISETPELTTQDTAIIYDAMETVDQIEDQVPEIKRFSSDADAIEALKRCEALTISFADCVQEIQKTYTVTGLEPDQVQEDGFAGFMVFPLEDGETVILDYNIKDDAQQFIYFGDIDALKTAANSGAFDEAFAKRVHAVTMVVKPETAETLDHTP